MQILHWSTVSFAVLCTMLLSSMGGSAAANTLCVNPKACRDANWSRRGPPPRRATGSASPRAGGSSASGYRGSANAAKTIIDASGNASASVSTSTGWTTSQPQIRSSAERQRAMLASTCCCDLFVRQVRAGYLSVCGLLTFKLNNLE
jgi:hypothetical protein